MQKERIVFLDYLRVVACFMVMAIHSCEPFYLGGEAPNVTFIANKWDMIWIAITECLCRVCVPLFVMTSSYLLFPVGRPTGEFFRRRFTRIVIPFAIWAVAYVACFGSGVASWGKILFNFPDEGGHLWFVPMLVGLYILMPLLSPWAEKVGAKELKGWIVVWFVTTTFPFLRQLWRGLYGEPPFGAVPYLWGECPWNAFGVFHYVSGFSGYVLLGLWFRKFAPSLDLKHALRVAVPTWLAGVAVMGLPLFFFVRSFPFSAPYQMAVVMETSIEYCSTGVALTTFAAFLVFRAFDFGGWFHRKVIQPISESSYGMYLLHMFILTPVFALLRPHMPTPIAILATAVVTFSCSAIAAIIGRRIPAVGKWAFALTVTVAGTVQGEISGTGCSVPKDYVPAMLSNGRICMTADFLGGIPPSPKKERGNFLTPGIFIEGRRLGPPRYNLYNHGRYSLTLSVDGKPYFKPEHWAQNLDAESARSVVTNVFGDVTRVVETFVAADADVIAVRQTFPGTDEARLAVGVDYAEPREERIVGKWEDAPDGCAFVYTAYGRNVDKGRITLRHVREDGAFVTFISFGMPYVGTYAAIANRHAEAWSSYYAASRVEVPDPELMRMRLMAEYQMKCNVTEWTIPVGIFPSHWSGKSFAFDEMYGVQGLLSAGHFAEARRAADFRFRTLPQAQQRVRHHTKKFFGYGARWTWEGMEDNVIEGSPLGYWHDHIFHMSAIARTCHLVAMYSDDLAYLREKSYPVMRECARFFRSQYVYETEDGSAFIGKCTDLERLGPGRDRPFMTTCGVIHTFRSCAEVAARLGLDVEEVADWRATADRLEKSLPIKDGRFAATANDLDALSMGTLAGYFPFPIFPKGHPLQTAAVDYFLAQGAKAGNMYPTGKKICPWYAGTMAMAALRAGEGEKVLPLLKEAARSAGTWGEYWEINEPSVAEFRPWFMTAAGNCLYAINQMLLMEADGECRLGAGVPADWKDYSFRLPAESGYEVDCTVKDCKVVRLILRTRHPSSDRRVAIVLPDGTRLAATLDRPEVAPMR